MSKQNETSDNHEQGNSSLGVVRHSTNTQRDFSKKWNELTLEIERLRIENSILKAQTPSFKLDCEEATYCMLIDEQTSNVLHTCLKPKEIYKDGDCIKIIV